MTNVVIEKIKMIDKLVSIKKINRFNRLFSRALSNKYLIFLIKNFIKEV
tara:strand:+ start:16 stop:162 length:147 start_codon:yes stop_codon:yes gene_type:complete